MSSPTSTTEYGKYIDLQNYLGSAPSASGSIYLSGSDAAERMYMNVGVKTPKLDLGSSTEVSAVLDEDNMASDSATALATQQSIKAYVDAQVTAQDLDFQADSGGALSIDLDSETLSIVGTTDEIVTAGSGNTITISLPDDVTIGDALTVTGQLDANGDVNLGNGTSDTVTVTGRFDSDLLPSSDSARDLGSSALQWAEVHADAGHIDAMTVTGTSTLGAVTATTISGSGAANLASLHCDSVNLDGGAIDGTVIGAASAAAGTFAALAGTTVTGSGAAQFASLHCDSVNLDGGAIDGVVIGASSAAAGTFAAVVATSLNDSDGNITNVGDLEVETVQSDADGVGLNINFDGNTGTNLISMQGSLASALDIKQAGGDSYLKFLTNNEYMEAGKEMAFTAGASIAANQTFSFGNDSSSPDAKLFVQSDALVVSGSANSGFGKTYVSGTMVVENNMTLGQGAGSSTFTLSAAIAGHVMPSADETYDLGHASNQYRDLYIDRIAYIDQLGTDADPTTAYISGGELDGVTIGGESAAAATVTNLTVNSAATLGSDGSGISLTMHGAAANESVVYTPGDHTLKWTDSSNAPHITIGGDANGEYAIDVVDGSNAKNKIRAAAFVTYSDERLKGDVKPMRGALKTVNSLQAVNFTWKKDGERDFGFLAQDLAKVVPQAVHGNDEGLFGVDYGRLTAVLVSAIQEQSLEIEALKAEIEKK